MLTFRLGGRTASTKPTSATIAPMMIHVESPGGCFFAGTEGTLHIDRGVLTSDPESIVKEPLGEKDVHLYKSPGHHRNWIDCIRSRKRPVADVEIGARSVAVVILGNTAYWHHHKLGWDPAKWEFTGDEPKEWMDRERRDPWKLPDVG